MMNTKRFWTFAVLVTFLLISLTACGDSYVVGGFLEPNDGSESNPVDLGSVPPERTFDGHIAALGTSYYKFTTTQAGLYRVRLANVSSYVDWTLYDDPSYANTVYKCNHGIFGDDVLCAVTLTAQTYYLLVEEQSFIAGPYDVIITPLL